MTGGGYPQDQRRGYNRCSPSSETSLPFSTGNRGSAPQPGLVFVLHDYECWSSWYSEELLPGLHRER